LTSSRFLITFDFITSHRFGTGQNPALDLEGSGVPCILLDACDSLTGNNSIIIAGNGSSRDTLSDDGHVDSAGSDLKFTEKGLPPAPILVFSWRSFVNPSTSSLSTLCSVTSRWAHSVGRGGVSRQRASCWIDATPFPRGLCGRTSAGWPVLAGLCTISSSNCHPSCPHPPPVRDGPLCQEERVHHTSVVLSRWYDFYNTRVNDLYLYSPCRVRCTA
jgi:hypothetical protein